MAVRAIYTYLYGPPACERTNHEHQCVAKAPAWLEVTHQKFVWANLVDMGKASCPNIILLSGQ